MYEKATPEHRVNPPNPDVDTVNLGLRIVFHERASLSRWTTPHLPSPRFEMLSNLTKTNA
jgi:hypothetical protein